MTRRRGQLALLAIASCTALYARTAIGPLQEALRASLALTDRDMALLQGPALGVPLILGAIPLGLLADRTPRVRLLLGALSVSLLGSLVTGFASGFLTLFLGRSLVGLATPTISIATASMIADLYASSERGRANMIVGIGQVMGMAIAFAAGGVVLTSLTPDPLAWRQAMLALTAPIVLILMLMLGLREPIRREVREANSRTVRALARVWDYRSQLTPLLAGVILVALADGATLTWLAPVLSRNHGVQPDRAGMIVATALLASGLLGPLIGGTLADRSQRRGGPKRMLEVLCALAAATTLAGVFPVLPYTMLAVAAMLIFLTVGVSINLMVTTLLTIVVPNELRGLALAFLWAAGALFGLTAAPLMVSSVSSALGGPEMIGAALCLVCISTGFIGTAFFALGRHVMRRDFHVL